EVGGKNMSPDQIGFALLYLGIFILIGKWLRIRVNWMQNLFLPSSMIAGFLALLVGPQVIGKLIGLWASDDSFFISGALPKSIINVWEELPGLMINIVFATLFLGKRIPSKKDIVE